jgi:hypothetical protein
LPTVTFEKFLNHTRTLKNQRNQIIQKWREQPETQFALRSSILLLCVTKPFTNQKTTGARQKQRYRICNINALLHP